MKNNIFTLRSLALLERINRIRIAFFFFLFFFMNPKIKSQKVPVVLHEFYEYVHAIYDLCETTHISACNTYNKKKVAHC